MAVIFDQQQGQYVVNQKPIAPTAPAPLGPKHDLSAGRGGGGGGLRGDSPLTDSLNHITEVVKYEKDMDQYMKDKAKYDQEVDQAELWNREDSIRKEVQEREDNALQRWVEDARKAGINPNLALGSQGSPSGGGITNASGKDYTLQNTLMQGDIDKAIQDLQQAFEGKENEKDRLNRIFSNLGLGALLKIK